MVLGVACKVKSSGVYLGYRKELQERVYKDSKCQAPCPKSTLKTLRVQTAIIRSLSTNSAP